MQKHLGPERLEACGKNSVSVLTKFDKSQDYILQSGDAQHDQVILYWF